MQAQYQYHLPPLHYQDLYHTQPTYQAQGEPNSYFSTADLDLSSFSRGSSLSYPHQDYEHFASRGRALASLPEPLLSMPSLSTCATGMGIAGNELCPRAVAFQPEGISDFSHQQRWQWDHLSEPLHGVTVAPPPHESPIHLSQQEFLTDKSSSVEFVNEAPVVLSPAAQLPTPASMAILLNPNSRSKRNSPKIVYHTLPASARNAQSEPLAGTTEPAAETEARATEQETSPTAPTDSVSREKKHACTMCHKRFDRPSTLRKHLLVHTGEKSFVCDTCGRRFGVASNRNRHLKACVRKCTNAARAAGKQQPPSAGGTTIAPSGSSPSTSDTTSSSSSSSSEQARPAVSLEQPSKDPEAPKVKRRRRAPSPSRWIPASLLSFNLSPPESKKATSVPLPPVRRNLPHEERDSWDENVASSPYHPQGWKNVLPGPGLGAGLGWKDLRNLDLERNGGHMLGRVLVF